MGQIMVRVRANVVHVIKTRHAFGYLGGALTLQAITSGLIRKISN